MLRFSRVFSPFWRFWAILGKLLPRRENLYEKSLKFWCFRATTGKTGSVFLRSDEKKFSKYFSSNFWNGLENEIFKIYKKNQIVYKIFPAFWRKKKLDVPEMKKKRIGLRCYCGITVRLEKSGVTTIKFRRHTYYVLGTDRRGRYF